MRRTPARRVEPGSALWRGFLASGSSGHDFMRSLSSPRRKVQLPYIIQCIKTAGKLATTSVCQRPVRDALGLDAGMMHQPFQHKRRGQQDTPAAQLVEQHTDQVDWLAVDLGDG